MYIHSYQIHNVLNVYRKQLSHENGIQKGQPPPAAPRGDEVELSSRFNRQTLINQVSAEIVDRIAQGGTQKRFEDVVSNELKRAGGEQMGRAFKKEVAFTYSVIDENDQKKTNTLPVENFSPLTSEVKREAQENAD